MVYIHKAVCISPLPTFENATVSELPQVVDGKLKVIEPSYKDIPLSILRRMGKAVRIGVGAALPILKDAGKVDGIMIGTANGGMEDCIKFLNQIVEYEEGTLTPTNFVQSTANAISSQIALLTANACYNVTHVHRGLAFENAAIDAMMAVRESPEKNYLLGGVDEISTYNYNIDFLDGWFKKEAISNADLYTVDSPGSIAGEGAAMFLVNGKKEGALANIRAIKMLHTEDVAFVATQLKSFITEHETEENKIDLFLSGEDGDNRYLKYYTACEKVLKITTAVARFKHLTGEHASAAAVGVWLACHLFESQWVPAHMVKSGNPDHGLKKILIYNNFKGVQHSFMLLSNGG
jgi:hypothetical protein